MGPFFVFGDPEKFFFLLRQEGMLSIYKTLFVYKNRRAAFCEQVGLRNKPTF